MYWWCDSRQAMLDEIRSVSLRFTPGSDVEYTSQGFIVLGLMAYTRLTLRDWNLQLRQPILLVDGRMVVSVSPQEGFLHQVSELDTLGYDRPESKCKLK